MTLAVYDPRWLACHTPHGQVKALAFTLSRRSPSHTGVLTEAQYQRIFAEACGIYGSTLDYAARTLEEQLDDEAQLIAESAADPEGREGVRAFVERRAPDFRGAR